MSRHSHFCVVLECLFTKSSTLLKVAIEVELFDFIHSHFSIFLSLFLQRRTTAIDSSNCCNMGWWGGRHCNYGQEIIQIRGSYEYRTIILIVGDAEVTYKTRSSTRDAKNLPWKLWLEFIVPFLAHEHFGCINFKSSNVLVVFSVVSDDYSFHRHSQTYCTLERYNGKLQIFTACSCAHRGKKASNFRYRIQSFRHTKSARCDALL